MRCSRPGGAGDRPRPGQGLLVAQVGPELRRSRCRPWPRPSWLRSVAKSGSIAGEVVDLGDPPRLGAVGEVAVGEQHHRGAVGDRDPGRLERRRRSSRPGDCGATIGTGASPLRPNIACSRSACSVLVGSPVEGPPRCTSMTSSGSSVITARPIVSDFSAMPGTRRGGHAERAGEGRADGRADAGDLVLGLERGDAERLVLAELVEDVGGRGDRVGAEEDRQPGLHARGDQAVGQRQVAGDVAVGAGRHRGRLDLVLHHERLGGLAEVPAGLERRDVGVADVGDLREPLRRGTRSWTRSAGRTSTTAGRARTCSSRGRRPCGTGRTP